MGLIYKVRVADDRQRERAEATHTHIKTNAILTTVLVVPHPRTRTVDTFVFGRTGDFAPAVARWQCQWPLSAHSKTKNPAAGGGAELVVVAYQTSKTRENKSRVLSR